MKNDLTSLYLFAVVCNVGSIAKAAQQQNIVASAISKRIADLEDYYQAPLLIRSKKGVIPTELGTILLKHIHQVQAIVNRMETEVRELANNPIGEVKILANISSINEFLPEMIASFSQIYPNIQITIEEKFSNEIVSAIERGYGDFGIARRVPYDAEKLTLQPFRQDHLVVAVNNQHPLANHSFLNFIDTLTFEHLSLSNYATMNNHMKAMAKSLDLKLNFKVQISSIDAACRMIANSNIIGILPKEALVHYTQSYDINLIPLLDTWAIGELVLYLKNNQELSFQANNFLNHILKFT